MRPLKKPGATGPDKLLEMRGVTAAYGTIPALTDISLAVPRGRTVALVGESGSGKSTAARVITWLLPPLSGEVRFEGEALPPTLKGRSREPLRRIRMIYQMADTAMNPRQTVHEIIGRPVRFYLGRSGAQVSARVSQLLDMIELDDSVMDRLPDELSGGQKQRICIARALAAEPDLVICDEVISALDQIVQEGILKLLMKLQKTLGLSYIFITHDIDTVRAIADEVVMMHRGEIVEQGLKEEIFAPPHPAYTELLLSSAPRMEAGWLERRIAAGDGGGDTGGDGPPRPADAGPPAP